ncbi:maleylpyruvate isomerase family mycothiol-dependent enzyme [Streptomyces sp. NPDC018031]|uniref:maleylpyruvate isomerase family mycothiol-dependent enzyme n=1 Tax=Streptomyces sp. NPDC018031 TaxID=3365033 RepID=UPI0037A71E70
MSTPGIDRLAEQLREQTTAFAAAVHGREPDAPVPTCPQWRLRDLVGHIGQAHRWAAGIVVNGAPDGVPDPREADPGAPPEWTGWLLDGAAQLVDAVRGAPPGATVWTYLGPRGADFWLRHMVNDTCVHHADAALAAGTAFRVGPEVAADAITEVLELLSAPDAAALKPALTELRGRVGTLQLSPRGTPLPGWLITLTPRGVSWERGTAAADAVVAGEAQDLLLLFTRRLRVGDSAVTITGDRALVEHWLAHTAL